MTEYAIETYAANAPLHVVAMRTADAKYATYSNWPEDGIVPYPQGEEEELYDYRTQGGRLEVDNSAGSSDVEDRLRSQYDHAFKHELREPLPGRLQPAHSGGFADYFRPPAGPPRRPSNAASAAPKREGWSGSSLHRPPLSNR